MQFVAIKARLVLRPTLRVKIKRRLKEAIRLVVTRGAAIEKSSGGPKLVFRGEDVGADKWIVPDWTYMALPTTGMLRMPFTEQVNLIRNALGTIRRRIPEVERKLEREGMIATSFSSGGRQCEARDARQNRAGTSQVQGYRSLNPTSPPQRIQRPKPLINEKPRRKSGRPLRSS